MISLSKRICIVLVRDDEVGMHAVGRALVHLFNRQTAYEQRVETTLVRNDIGFTAGDGKRGVSMAKYYMRHGKLTPRQVAYWQGDAYGKLRQPRITKYRKQLCEEAVKKQAAKQGEMAV